MAVYKEGDGGRLALSNRFQFFAPVDPPKEPVMNSSMRLMVFSAVCAFVSSTATSRAEPLDTARVPSKAVWVMHLDMDAARGSTVLRNMEARMLKKHPHLEQMMAMGAGIIGMDVRKDLHDVTVYGLDTDKHNAVMIVHAKADRKKLETMVEKAKDHVTSDHRGYTLHGWTHKGGRQSEGRSVVGAFYNDSTMVFAQTKGQVEKAIDVFDGKSTSLSDDSPLAGRVRPGTILVGRAIAVNPDTKCPVLKEAQGFRVAMGEHEGNSFYRGLLDMNSAEAAQQAKAVTEGMVALGSLSLGGEPEAMKLVQGVTASTEGQKCLITWDAKAGDVWTVVEKLAEKMEAKMAKRKAEWNKMHGGKSDGAGKKKEKSPPKAEKPFRDDEF
jgi:hypothetical protein